MALGPLEPFSYLAGEIEDASNTDPADAGEGQAVHAGCSEAAALRAVRPAAKLARSHPGSQVRRVAIGQFRERAVLWRLRRSPKAVQGEPEKSGFREAAVEAGHPLYRL